jgi:hypothetical protein
MMVDFLTKRLQGQLFRTFRDALLGIQHTTAIADAPLAQTDERVELKPFDKVNDDYGTVTHDAVRRRGEVENKRDSPQELTDVPKEVISLTNGKNCENEYILVHKKKNKKENLLSFNLCLIILSYFARG